jgi:uncharacterized protein YndB with AHSA1/START domain
MNKVNAVSAQDADLVLEYELDAPPEKVWRAITNPALREKWLPKADLCGAEPVSSKPGEEICFRMRDDEPPFLESTVTFQVRPGHAGGARLRIIQQPSDARLAPRPANSNQPLLMRAA